MKIVFLDKLHFQAIHETFDYSGLQTLGNLVCYDRTREPEQIIARAQDADVILALKTKLPTEIMSQLNCKLICKVGTGVDNFDLTAAKERGITVVNFPGYGSNMVAQWTLSLIMLLASNIDKYQVAVKNHHWLSSQFAFPICELADKTLGIIGFGAIGKRVAKMATVIGLKILVNTRYTDDTPYVEFVDKEHVYRESDILSLHGNLDEHTRDMINKDTFAKMQKHAFLINTARAGLINKVDLYHALKQKIIAGAALDGYWDEPPQANDPLLQLDNIIVTPHMAWASKETRQRLLHHIAQQIENFAAGKPTNNLV